MDYARADKIRRFAESCKKDGCNALISPDDLLTILDIARSFEADYFRINELSNKTGIAWEPGESGILITDRLTPSVKYGGESLREAVDLMPKRKPRKPIFNRPDL